MSSKCLKQLNDLIQKFDLPLNIQPEWIKGCYSNYVLSSIEYIEQSLMRWPHRTMNDVIKSGVIKQIINLLRNNNYKFQILCSGYVRELSIQYEVPQELLKFIDKLCDRDYYINDKVQILGRWILCSIAAGSSEQTRYIIDNGATQILIDGIKKQTSISVKIPSIQTLGNIAGDRNTKHRDLILSYNITSQLLPYCMHSSSYSDRQQLELQRILAWTLMNLCCKKPAPKSQYIEDLLKAFRILILNDDEQILEDTCRGYTNILDCVTSLDWVLQSGVLPRLIQLLEHKNSKVVLGALRTVGNVAGDDCKYTQAVINHGGLKKLYALMKHDKKVIKNEACWTVSNITAGSEDQIEAVIASNLCEPLIDILSNEELEIATEALYAISNAIARGNIKQILFLLNQGVIQSLFKFSKRMNNRLSVRTVMEIFETIAYILEAGRELNGERIMFAKYAKDIDGIDWLKQLHSYQIVSEDIEQQPQNMANDINEICERLIRILELEKLIILKTNKTKNCRD